jgi:hypothetical protein
VPKPTEEVADVPESAEEETGKPVNNGVPELTGAVADVPESAEE